MCKKKWDLAIFGRVTMPRERGIMPKVRRTGRGLFPARGPGKI